MSSNLENETIATAGDASVSSTSQCEDWPGVAEVPFPVVAARAITEEQLEFEATIHDRCRSQLRDVVHQWVNLSGKVYIGDRVRIAKESSPANDKEGIVMDYNSRTHQAKVCLDEHVRGERVGIVDRSDILKIHGTRSDGVPLRVPQIEQQMVMQEFLSEAALEIDRLDRRIRVDVNGANGDRDGKFLSIGDIVMVTDRKHLLFEWKVMIDNIGSDGMLHCMIGMPTLRFRETIEDDLEARNNRPRQRTCKLMCDQVIVDGLDLD